MPFNDLHQLGLSSLGYLVERNQRITAQQFAKLIRAQVDNPRAHEVANAFEELPGLIEQSWRGVTFIESAGNEAEIAARNAGITVSSSQTGFGLIGKEANLPKQVFISQSEAWQAAADLVLQSTQNQRDEAQLYIATLRDYLGDARCLDIVRGIYRATHNQEPGESDELYLLRCLEQDYEPGSAIFDNLARCIRDGLPIVSANLVEKQRGAMSPCEIELMYAVRDRQLAELKTKSSIEITGLVSLERTGRCKVADELYGHCDNATRTALLNDHHFVSATTRVSSLIPEKMKHDPMPHQMTYSGTIAYFAEDKPILLSMTSIKLGHDIDVAANGCRTAHIELSEQGLTELDPYFGTFSWSLDLVTPKTTLSAPGSNQSTGPVNSKPDTFEL